MFCVLTVVELQEPGAAGSAAASALRGVIVLVVESSAHVMFQIAGDEPAAVSETDLVGVS